MTAKQTATANRPSPAAVKGAPPAAPAAPGTSSGEGSNAAPPAGATPAPEKAKRTRSGMPQERKLAIALINVLAEIDKPSTVMPKASEAIVAARALVKETEEKIVGPARRRIAEIHKELQAAVADVTKIDAAKIKELNSELQRQQKKLAAVTGAPASAPTPPAPPASA